MANPLFSSYIGNQMDNYIVNTYRRLPVAFSKGDGCWLYDNSDNKYLDALSGIAVCGLGHSHPKFCRALCNQVNRLIHTSNLYQIDNQTILAEKLCNSSGMEGVFFCNSGAEANEAAIKTARLFGHNKGIKNPNIICTNKSFHGRTIATLTATGNPKIKNGFDPLPAGFKHVDYSDTNAIITAIDDETVAVMVEPVQGEGGVNIPATDYLQQIRDICSENEILMIVDEVQTGIGRTGKMFAFQNSDITPDIMTLAKGLGNGVPIGCCLVNNLATEVLQPGTHGSTFGGNPLACRAGISVLEIIEEENILENVTKVSAYINKSLTNTFADVKEVVAIRNTGMMIGMEMSFACAEIVGIALNNGLLINVTADKVIRLLPPLIMTEAEAGILTEKLTKSIEQLIANKK